VLERLVLTGLRPHLESANITEYQSPYKKRHSTESALLEGVYMTADNKQVTVLIGLHLSVAFDTVDPAPAAAV